MVDKKFMAESIAKERILRPNKIKFIFWFLIFLAFFSFSIYMIFFYPRVDGKVMGGGLSLLISGGLFFLLYKSLPWKATLILNREGIYINNLPLSESNKVGKLLRWNNIRSIGKFRQRILFPRFPYTGKQDYLVIYLNTSKEDFSNDKESFGISRYEEIKQGGQILIPLNFLPYYSIDKNLDIFREYPINIEN